MSDDAYKRAFQREKKARLEAEQLLENKSRELYLINQELSLANDKISKSHEALVSQHSVLVKNEKLASIGLLSAGIAHEINNPLAFVSSNLEMLDSYWQAMDHLYQTLQNELHDAGISDDKKLLFSKLITEKDLEYIASDFINLFEDTQDGLMRVTTIVQNLQHFSRIQEEDWSNCDINKSLKSTLKIINHQIKNANCKVELSLASIPAVWCNLGELNQVFLNLLQNAIHAMESLADKVLTLSTWQEDQNIFIRIKDNGKGIKAEHFEKIFDPFFTTKTIGEGTGLGLYISHKIVSDHGGEIDIVSEPNAGAQFTIQLPIKKQQDKAN